MLKKLPLFFVLFFFVASPFIEAQEKSTNQIKNLIKEYKQDRRGPYSGIKWFCKDGSQREARDPCPDNIGGGIQHASFKSSVVDLRKTNHLFFGEILASLSSYDFIDKKNNFSRLKQYQIGKYLSSVDDGWVLRRAQYYRGAFQSEDEEAWGKDFFETLLRNDDLILSNYFLFRQALKDIPHNGDSNLAQDMRSESKLIAEDISSFMDVRIKIHGQPDVTDIALVESYVKKNDAKLSVAQKKEFSKLLVTMREYYAPINFEKLSSDVNLISEKNTTTELIADFLKTYRTETSPKVLVTEVSRLLYEIRLGVNTFKSSKDRLKLLDISNQLEHTLLKEVQNWQVVTLEDNLDKISALACASAGTGLIETWEYNAIDTQLNEAMSTRDLSIETLNTILTHSRSIVEWSTSMVKANYQADVDKYTAFEPMTYSFIDDRVRSSVALNLGETVSNLGVFVSKVSKINNQVMNIESQTAIRGLNPGYAFGELVVVDGNPDDVEVNTNKIYIFEKPPHDLKPVAGIMTVSEGNLVSHVQLLARNLGIPNAVLSYDNLKALKKYNGKKVFYAVSNKGNVVLKAEDEMSANETALFSKKERSKNVIEVPIKDIRLDVSKVINMRDVNASDSGKLCGPKAANLGELKHLFPDQVVEGLIIPFGVFKSHMNLMMPGENISYWTYLNNTFAKADSMRAQNESEEVIEAFQLANLKKLHDAIIKIPLDATFKNDLYTSFKSAFGNSIGNVPVFLRSDTNMEDLKEFTGAGLNLTLFNIKNEDEIVKGIKRVWASAYTERSFKWRQKYLSNPENVFPSILIIPSVDVDYSGVMITKGINSGNDDDLTVAFSRGAGGAVDGQSAETRLITEKGNTLLAPARQADYIRLPDYGGTKGYFTTFESPILNEKNIEDIRKIAKKVRAKMTEHTASSNQAYDVEFGFKDDKLWLFQIRPFVENKKAKSSEYLLSITPKIDADKMVSITTPL
ncbi:Prodigiosin synthesizing transferase PigC [Kordia antarctica]|uniref:Prodigiosin synthesizing transferase PigC n=1 Tax=Kordia antarctica TaxID=1218801 RepID=A0A7L4ZEK0_9FLAO|nr:PEP/pyruvate-binding domain-containing protein [Kordia antarctica]QHI35007.1 Prodigiosin synthesizing transferase PigC [Kordia antarctica]